MCIHRNLKSMETPKYKLVTCIDCLQEFKYPKMTAEEIEADRKRFEHSQQLEKARA